MDIPATKGSPKDIFCRHIVKKDDYMINAMEKRRKRKVQVGSRSSCSNVCTKLVFETNEDSSEDA